VQEVQSDLRPYSPRPTPAGKLLLLHEPRDHKLHPNNLTSRECSNTAAQSLLELRCIFETPHDVQNAVARQKNIDGLRIHTSSTNRVGSSRSRESKASAGIHFAPYT
jgi:hypothetical protein